MRIPLHYEQPNGEKEWSIVELQGELVCESKASLTLGQLEYQKGVPTLRIGNHLLEGKSVKLQKPMAIMKKMTKIESPYDTLDGKDGYVVVGIAKKKLIFNTRPKPVVTDQPSAI